MDISCTITNGCPSVMRDSDGLSQIPAQVCDSDTYLARDVLGAKVESMRAVGISTWAMTTGVYTITRV